ncbi:MAG: cyclic nucleotide-binding domain-containing protein [Alphaproteobacteria bacterium]
MLFSDKLLERRGFAKGMKVFSQGEKGDAAYLVETGKIAIFKHVEDKKVHLATLVGGALFGEMAVIDGSARMASAVALEDSVLMCIPRDVFLQKLQNVDPFVKALITILLENLRNVHKAYIVQPRSVQDIVKVIGDWSDILRQYTNMVDMDSYSTEVAKRLDSLSELVAELKVLMVNRPDRRGNVIPPPESLTD